MFSPASSVSSPRVSISPRQNEVQKALRRAVAHAFTSLDVSRRKWAKQSDFGRHALTACVNALTQLAYADGPHWGALDDCAEMQRLLATRALQRVRSQQAGIDAALESLDETLGSLRNTCSTLRERVDALGSDLACGTPLFDGCSESALQFLAHAEALVASFERELTLRRTVAAQLRHTAVDERTAALYLSAWVLQPYVDTDRLELLLAAVSAEADPQNALRSPRTR